MSKPVKDMMTAEIRERYGEAESALVVNPILLTGTEANDLRRRLAAKRIRMEVIKNSLARRALTATKLKGLGDLLDGPSAVVTGGDSVIDIAREMVDWAKKVPKLKLCGAIVEGETFGPETVQSLATMPTRTEMLGQIVGLACSPGASLASAVMSPGAAIAGCIESLITKLEESGEGES